jgi:hypothetical protein
MDDTDDGDDEKGRDLMATTVETANLEEEIILVLVQ